MAAGDPFATPDDLRAYMRVDSTVLSDTDAAAFLAGATAAVIDHCGWGGSADGQPGDLWQQTGVLKAQVHGGGFLKLPVKGLANVTAITVASPYTEWIDTAIDLSLLADVDAIGTIQLRDGYYWTYGELGIVKVSCDWGYDPLPSTLVSATCSIASRGTINPEGLQSRTVGTVSERFAMAGRGITMTGFAITETEEVLLSPFEVV